MLQGLPASGKTTWSRKFVEEKDFIQDPWIRVNRDDIRRMFGEYWIPAREDLVTKIEIEAIYEALKEGYSVVVDDTNLNLKTSNRLKNIAKDFNVKFETKVFDTSLEECLKRDRCREYPVGSKTIISMFDKYF